MTSFSVVIPSRNLDNLTACIAAVRKAARHATLWWWMVASRGASAGGWGLGRS